MKIPQIKISTDICSKKIPTDIVRKLKSQKSKHATIIILTTIKAIKYSHISICIKKKYSRININITAIIFF